MLSQEIQKALNLQIAHEQANAHIYRAVACWFQKQCLFGFEKYFKKQVAEETGHAEKLIEYVEDRDGNVELMSLPAPKMDYANVAEASRPSPPWNARPPRLQTLFTNRLSKPATI